MNLKLGFLIASLCSYSCSYAYTPATTDENIDLALNRMAMGPSIQSVAEIKTMGLEQWIKIQLKAKDSGIPDIVQNEINQMDISKYTLPQLIDYVQVPKDMQQNEDVKKQIRQREELLVYETFRRQALRNIYDSNQLKEQMTWFWSNHFSVYSQKGPIKVFLSDYEENVISQYALGNFKNLLMATLEHPAMLTFLDNYDNTAPNSLVNQKLKPNQTPKGINENYAREILELHTLGQGQGYTQKDVQELARILTGVTFRKNLDELKMRPEYQAYAVTQGYFLFDPRRHDFGDKEFLGHTIKGSGFPEVQEAIELIAQNPHTAFHISEKLAYYFLNDNPSPVLVNSMSQTFLKTQGDIPSVLNVLFHSKEFWLQAHTQSKFKMPHQYVFSSLRLAYGTHLITNYKPIWNTLNNLGEMPYGRQTPDGYALKEKDWASADQMEKRLEFASMLANKKSKLFNPDEALNNMQYKIDMQQTNSKASAPSNNMSADNPANFDSMYDLMEPLLSEKTKNVINQAPINEKMNLLLSSPEMMKD